MNTLNTDGARADFASRQNRIASQFLQSEEGLGAVLGTFRSMAGQRAAGDDRLTEEQAFVNIVQAYGLANEREADLLYDLSTKLQESSAARRTALSKQLAADARRDYLAREHTIAGLTAKAGQGVYNTLGTSAFHNAGAAAINNFGRMAVNTENALFGIEYAAGELYSQSTMQDVNLGFALGDQAGKDYFADPRAIPGNPYIQGGPRTSRRQDTLINLAKGDRDGSAFLQFTGSGVDTASVDAKIESLAKDVSFRRSVQNFDYETQYGDRNQEMGILSNNAFISDTDATTRKDLEERLRAGGVTDDEMEYALAAATREDGSYQRYVAKNMKFSEDGTVNTAKERFLSSVGTSYDSSAGLGAAGIGAAIGGGIGAIVGAFAGGGVASAATGVAGYKLGALAGAAIVGGTAAYFGGQSTEVKDLLEQGVGTKLMSKLNSKEKLRNFDSMFREELRRTGNKEEAYSKVADRLSKKFGDSVTPEDVKTAMDAYEQTTGQSYRDRLTSGNYSSALKLSGQAGAFVESEVTEKHLDAIRDSIAGEAGVTDLVSALHIADEDSRRDASRAAMLDMARKAMSGESVYEGQNEALQTIAGESAVQLGKQLGSLVNKDVSALDAMFGTKGIGARLRKSAGVRQVGTLGREELKEIAARMAVSQGMSVESDSAAARGTAGPGADGDLFESTANLHLATKDLAKYVDNIGAVMTGRETAGVAMPGFRNAVKDNS